MIFNAQEVQETLEHQVDALGLSVVLELLAQVCGDKAEHLRSNWQDNASARVWDRAGASLDRLSAAQYIRDTRP